MPVPSGTVIALPTRGPQGDPGSAAGTHHHIQSSPSADWVINHGLGRKPPLELFLDDAPAVPVWTDLEYPDDNTTLVHLPIPATGHAYM